MAVDECMVLLDEVPLREVELRPFWIDRHAVSDGDFAAFVEAAGQETEAERFGERLLVPDEVEDEPDYEPDESHGVSFRRGNCSSHGNAEPPGERRLGVVGLGGAA